MTTHLHETLEETMERVTDAVATLRTQLEDRLRREADVMADIEAMRGELAEMRAVVLQLLEQYEEEEARGRAR